MNALLLLLLWLTTFLGPSAVGPVSGTLCPEGLSDWNVSTTAEALELSDALQCSGPGQFEVHWSGEVLLTRTITISNDSSVAVWGHGAGEAVIDGGGAVRLFEVDGGSRLQLSSLSLVGGWANKSGGGAVLVSDSSQLNASNCLFIGNEATYYGGAIDVSGGDVTIDGNTTFAFNTAESAGGAIDMYEGDVTIDGNTTFASNTAGSGGGAMYVSWGDVTIDGNTTFASNTAVDSGGAILVSESNLSIDGNTTFASNTAESAGGAIDMYEGNLTIDGNTTFASNTAVDSGGAMYVSWGDVTIDGNTTFASNTAESAGGAIYVYWSNLTIDGNTTFASNTAVDSGGGAINANDCNMTIDGDTTFTSNTAAEGGGALFVSGASELVMASVDTLFANNSATGNGGAVAVVEDSSLVISGSIHFRHNTAQEHGGAIAVYDSTILAEGATNFNSNRAMIGAGGGIYCSNAVAFFNGCAFTENKAVWGGGLALFSSGSVWDKDAPENSGPANTTMCIFERNKAVDGGAIYSAAGYDMIQNSSFEENLAEGPGGAYLQAGVLVELGGSTFVGNRAGDGGPAVMSLGMVENITKTSFESNTKYCPSGEYGYDLDEFGDEVSDTCRFDIVCKNCAASCGEISNSVNVVNDSSVPTCEIAMTGVNASGDGGMTLSTLKLDRGYYRTSIESRVVLKCHQENACIGGVEPSQYCEEGYQGPYCAVCKGSYASGYQYSCSSCVGKNRRSAIGTSAALFVVALICIALVIADLIRVVDENSTDTASTWKKRLNSCRDRIANTVPLASIKIVVVAWQIVTQFSSVVNVVYPDVYEKFLSTLNLVNLNLGFILSVSCIVDTNFYGRLVFVTIGPLVVLGVLGGTYAVSRSRNRHHPVGIQVAKHKHMSFALLLVFFIYSSVSFTIFQTFVCETLDNGVEYLRADYSLTCSTGIHTVMQVYAGVMIFLYPVGIPVFFAWWLGSNRHDPMKVGSTGTSLDASTTLDYLQPMRDLWAPYKPHRYYYEVVEYCRRIALTGLAVFVMPGSSAQVAIEVVLAVVFMVVSENLSPFADPLDAWLYRSGQLVVFFSMYLCLLLKVDASGEDSRSQVVFAKVLIAAHACMVLMVVVQAVLSLRRGLVSVRDQPVANQSFRVSSLAQVCDGEVNPYGQDESESQWSTEADETASGTALRG